MHVQTYRKLQNHSWISRSAGVDCLCSMYCIILPYNTCSDDIIQVGKSMHYFKICAPSQFSSLVLVFKKQAMGIFYHDQLHIQLHWKERLILFEYWHAINIFSDLCTVIGTVLVIHIDQNFDCAQVSRAFLLHVNNILPGRTSHMMLKELEFFWVLGSFSKQL